MEDGEKIYDDLENRIAFGLKGISENSYFFI